MLTTFSLILIFLLYTSRIKNDFKLIKQLEVGALSPDTSSEMKGVGGVESLLLELPEYEDPDVIFLELNETGEVPLLTALEGMAKQMRDLVEEKDTTYYEDVKESLNDIIKGLEFAKIKLEQSLNNLKKLQYRLLTVKNVSVSTSIQEHNGSNRDDKVLNVRVKPGTHTTIIEESAGFEYTSEEKRTRKPSGDALLITKTKKPLHNFKKIEHSPNTDVQPVSTSIQVHITSKRDDNDSSTGTEKPNTHTPFIEESSDVENTSQEKRIETPFGGGFLITETDKNEKIPPGKGTNHTKLILKSPNII